MRLSFIAYASLIFATVANSSAAQTPDDPTIAACKAPGLLALQAQAPEITDLIFDMETLAVSAADTKIENIPVTAVVLGEAYISRKEQSAKPIGSFACSARRGKFF
jgi:hypothetical protein